MLKNFNKLLVFFIFLYSAFSMPAYISYKSPSGDVVELVTKKQFNIWTAAWFVSGLAATYVAKYGLIGNNVTPDESEQAYLKRGGYHAEKCAKISFLTFAALIAASFPDKIPLKVLWFLYSNAFAYTIDPKVLAFSLAFDLSLLCV